MSTVTTSMNKLRVDTPVNATLPNPVQNYNSTFLTLQHGQCAMCGQLNLHISKDALNMAKLSVWPVKDPIMHPYSAKELKKMLKRP